MTHRKHWTCSSVPQSCCGVLQRDDASTSRSPSRVAHKAIRWPQKTSAPSRTFSGEKSAFVEKLETSERNDENLVPKIFSYCQASSECSSWSNNFPRSDNCLTGRGVACLVPGGKCQAAECILDTAYSGGRFNTADGNFSNVEGIFDTADSNTADGNFSNVEGILDTGCLGRADDGGPGRHLENARLDCENCGRDCRQEFYFYSKFAACAAVAGRGFSRRGGSEEAPNRRGDGGESFTLKSRWKESCERTYHKMWSLLSFHKKSRIFSAIFFVLLTTAVSAHPLNTRPDNSPTLIFKPFVSPAHFTPSTEPHHPNSAREAPISEGSKSGGGHENSGGEAENSAGHHRILDTEGAQVPSGAQSSVSEARKTGDLEQLGVANEIGSDLESWKEDTKGARQPSVVPSGNPRVAENGIGVPGMDPTEEVEDFDEALKRPPTPQEAERIARFNVSGMNWSLLKDAVSQLMRDVAQRRWLPTNTSWQLDNSTSFSEALHHTLTEDQLRQLRARDFSRLDFRELQSEIALSLPDGEGSAESSSGEREGRAFTYRLPRFLFNLGRMLDLETVINEVETSIMTSVSCNACKGGVGLLQHYIEQGNTKEDIVRAASKLCTNFRVETPRVCFGILHLMGDEVMYVMQNLVMQPDGICGFLIGDVCGIAPDPYHKWRVLFPPYPKPPVQLIKPPKEDTPTYKVLHLSDTHYDPYYLEGSNAECNEPMCCRATSGTPENDRAKAGKWGDYRKCDTPKRTIVSMYQHIAQAHPDVDYIIWTGDLPPHDIWNQTRDSNLLVLRETVEQIRTFFPGVPVFPALGNHESAPVNSFPPPSIPPQHSVQWLYDDLMVQWLQWLPPHTAPTIQKGGYYSVLLAPGFRIVSLNMNFCNNKNWWLLLDSEDPADQLQWLVYELQAAELKGEHVHILGHIPPGYHDCLKVWSRNFYTIVNRYESTIAAQFYGHTHYDEFEVFYDADNVTRPTSVAYVGPSVTTYPDLNPGYRVYSVERDAWHGSHRVVDHETWVMDLDVANLPSNADADPHWYRLYSAREAYEMRSLLPVDWDNLVYRMVEDQQLFDTFYRHYWKNSPKREPCDAECKKRLLCDLKSGRSNDRKKTCAVVHERVEAQERSQWRSWLYSGLTLTSLATLFVML